MNAIALFALLAALARGPVVTADRVEIVVTPPVPDQNAIIVFSNGMKRVVALTASKGQLDDTLLDATGVTASVYFANGRTDCGTAARTWRDGAKVVARFDLQWTKQPVWRLSVRVDPQSQPVTYVRLMPVDCREPGRFRGSDELANVLPYTETLFFRLGELPDEPFSYHVILRNGAYRRREITAKPLAVRREQLIELYAADGRGPEADNMKDVVDRLRLPKDFKTITFSRSEE